MVALNKEAANCHRTNARKYQQVSIRRCVLKFKNGELLMKKESKPKMVRGKEKEEEEKDKKRKKNCFE